MFRSATSFNRDLAWGSNTGSVTTMENMFYGASSFNGAVNGWHVSRVTNMNYMFYNAVSFNQDMGLWTPVAATTMNSMFYGATAFNQNIAWVGNTNLVTS